MDYLNPLSLATGPQGELQHTGWATGSYHLGGCRLDIIHLALKHGHRFRIVLQVVGTSRATAPVSFCHFGEIYPGYGFQEGTRLLFYALVACQMARVVKSNRQLVVRRFHL